MSLVNMFLHMDMVRSNSICPGITMCMYINQIFLTNISDDYDSIQMEDLSLSYECQEYEEF